MRLADLQSLHLGQRSVDITNGFLLTCFQYTGIWLYVSQFSPFFSKFWPTVSLAIPLHQSRSLPSTGIIKLLYIEVNKRQCVDWTGLRWPHCVMSASPISVRHRPAHHLRGPGRDADGPAGPALPGALHSPHQPGCGAVAQGVAPVLDWEWICGEYQFDMTAYRRRTMQKDPPKSIVKNKNRQSKVNIFWVE